MKDVLCVEIWEYEDAGLGGYSTSSPWLVFQVVLGAVPVYLYIG